MITAKTESGFSIELEDDALEDQELFDAISGMQDGNVFSMRHLTCLLYTSPSPRDS